jgi:hypothetical protein
VWFNVIEIRSSAQDFRNWHECDLRVAPINVRSWESNGLNADVVFGPFMTQTGSRIIRLVVRSEYKRGMPNRWLRLELEQFRATILPD